MAESYNEKGRLPACHLDRSLFDALWALFGQDGDYTWRATVGTGGDLLGKDQDRPQERVEERDRLPALLATLPRIDSLQFTAEVPGRGALSFTFQNYNPPAGALVVASDDAEWAAGVYDAVDACFQARRDDSATRLYSRWCYALMNTVVPLAASSLLVVLAAVLFIPYTVRQSDLLWWITAGTVFATIWLGGVFSNKILAWALSRHPYIRWRS